MSGSTTWRGWTITVREWRLGEWEYTASKGRQYASGWVQAWDIQQAAKAAILEIGI